MFGFHEVEVKGTASPLFQGCHFSGWDTAISCLEQCSVKLVDCSFSKNPGTCISARQESQISMENCRAVENGAPVLLFKDCSSLSLSKCSLEQNKGCGLLVRNKASAVARSSSFRGHKMSAVAFQHESRGEVLDCRLEPWALKGSLDEI